MSSTMSDLREYEARVNSDSTGLLGHVVLYSVRDTRILHETLVQILKDHGLGGFAPRRPADVDVFRRVCTGAQRKRTETSDPDIWENVLVRDVSKGNADVIAKRIVVERVDTSGRRLDYREAYDVSFDRSNSRLSVKRVGTNSSSASADEVAQEIVREFPAQVGAVDGNAIRTLINRALYGSKAVSIRDGGGAYFCGLEHTTVVEGLEAMATVIDGTTVNSIPLPDVPKQREMLRSSVEFEANEEVERTMAEIRKLLKGNDGVTVDQLTGFMARYRGLKDKAATYSQLLESNLGTTTTALDVLARQIRALSRKAES